MAEGDKPKITGGEKALSFLNDLITKLSRSPTIKVGFLEDATYSNGMNVATVAYINEFGATINMPAREQTVYRKTNATKTGFLKGGKFVKKKQANFSSTHHVEAHTITIPPRPFFRNMIAKHKAEWGPQAAALIKKNKFDLLQTAEQMGQLIKGELQQSILDTNSPPNSSATIAKKKSAKTLVDSGLMLSRVDFEVSD